MFTFSDLESAAESKRGLAIPAVTLFLAHLNLTLRCVIAIKSYTVEEADRSAHGREPVLSF